MSRTDPVLSCERLPPSVCDASDVSGNVDTFLVSVSLEPLYIYRCKALVAQGKKVFETDSSIIFFICARLM